MDNTDGTSAPTTLSTADGFALLGSEHRMKSLRALLDLLRTEKEYPASFSALEAETGKTSVRSSAIILYESRGS